MNNNFLPISLKNLKNLNKNIKFLSFNLNINNYKILYIGLKEYYNVIEIYRGLLELFEKIGFKEEVSWYENRLKILNVIEPEITCK